MQDLYTETYAARLLHKKEYKAAIPWLKKTIDREKNFKQKKRLQYLLGQIYARNGETTMAWQAFEDVKGLSTPAAFNRQALLAQRALQDKPIQTELPEPPEKPDTAEKQDPDTRHFQDYFQAYLKRSSIREAATDSISRPSPLPEKINFQSAQPPSGVNRPETIEERKKRLEQKAAEALQQKQQAATNKSREKLLKEREKERKEKIRQREKELRERERNREAAIKQREQQREQQMRKPQRQ